jgi:hypothetical protein
MRIALLMERAARPDSSRAYSVAVALADSAIERHPAETNKDSIADQTSPPPDEVLNLSKDWGRSGDRESGSFLNPVKSSHMGILRHLSLVLASWFRILHAAKKRAWYRGAEADTALSGENKPLSPQKDAHLAV